MTPHMFKNILEKLSQHFKWTIKGLKHNLTKIYLVEACLLKNVDIRIRLDAWLNLNFSSTVVTVYDIL